MDCEVLGVTNTFVQGQKTSFQLIETTSIANDDKAKKCLNGKQKDNLVQKSDFNSSSKEQLNSYPKYQGLSSDKNKSLSDKKKTPSDKNKLPSDKNKSQSDKNKSPSDKNKSPSDKKKPPSDKKKTPSEKNKSQSDKNKSPSDKNKVPSDVVDYNLFDISQIWLVWQYIHSQMLVPLWCRLLRKFFVFDMGKNNRSNGMQLILLIFCVLSTSYALNIPSVTIVTSPIVFGEDATLQCVYKDNRLLSSLATVWLKGQEKECIIYGNSSTKGEKYTSVIFHDGDVYRNQMTIRNVSRRDLGPYSCGVNFQEASLEFTMDKNISFIYIPDTSDIVCNISASKLNIWIQQIYPEPNCAVFCNDKVVSNLLKSSDRSKSVMYSTLIQIHLSKCRSGDLRMSCRLDTKSFNWSMNVQQCCKENECSTEIESNVEYYVAIGLGITITLLFIIGILYCTCRKDKGRPVPPTRRNLLE